MAHNVLRKKIEEIEHEYRNSDRSFHACHKDDENSRHFYRGQIMAFDVVLTILKKLEV